MHPVDWIRLKRRPGVALPTIQEDHRGQIRNVSGDGATTTDTLWYARNDAGTDEWAALAIAEDVTAEIDSDVATHAALTAAHGATGAVVGTTNTQTLTNKTMTEPVIGNFTNAQHDHTSPAQGGFLPFYYAMLGPFFANDLAANATVALEAAFFNTATALSRSTPDIYVPTDGEVVGMFAILDANRTTGTATLTPVINGSGQTFDGGGTCVIDGTNTRRHGVVVARGDGEDFAAGQRVALQVTTSGWGPTTANMTAWMLVRFDL